MREECKHFQSRTYPSGEVARFCVLDLAPEAPWRCPDNCPRYQRRLADAGWQHGDLVEPAVEAEPDEPAGEIGDILSEAELVVDSAAPAALAEARERERRAEREANKANKPLGRWFRRRRF